MIDDHPKNFGTFSGKKIIFTQPHNISAKDDTYHRVSAWKNVMEIL